MKSILVKIIAFAAAASVLALVGGYCIGYDATAVAATKPQLRFMAYPKLFRFSPAGRPGSVRLQAEEASHHRRALMGVRPPSGPWPERRLAVRLAPPIIPGDPRVVQ